MKQVTTYVGIDAHKKDLFIAMLIGDADDAGDVDGAERAERGAALGAEARARGAGPGAGVLRSRAVRLCVAAADDDAARELSGDRAGADPAEAGRADQDQSPRCAQAGGAAARAGLLTEVRPPTPEEEAVRDLCRARDDAREDLQRCRHRLGKLLLRRGLHFSGRNWTQAHRRWIDSLEWTQPRSASVVDDYLLAIDHLEARLIELDARLAEIAQTEPYREPVGWLRCFRGIDTLTAILILAELHDFRRFQSPRALMAYLGLVPGEDSSGEKHRRGRITRTGQRAGPPAAGGNGVALSTSTGHRRRAHAPTQGTTEPRDCDCGQGAAATVSPLPHAWRQQHKPAPKIAVAIARELAGFLWAALQPAPVPATLTARRARRQ